MGTLPTATAKNGIYQVDSNELNMTLTKAKKIVASIPNYIADASYYTNVPSASVDSIKKLMRFFHEVWNHASMELMCSIVKYKLILNLPETLTEKAIRKHFPNCNACPVGNLQQRPALSLPAERELAIGEEFEIDLIGQMTDENKKMSFIFRCIRRHDMQTHQKQKAGWFHTT